MTVWRAQSLRLCLRSLKGGLRRSFEALALLLFVVATVTAAAAVLEPLPEVLRLRRHGQGLVVRDNLGHTLGQIRGDDYRLTLPIQHSTAPRTLLDAVIAAEDARFHYHPGVDPLAILRAVWQSAGQHRVVSGASTITQQVARSVRSRPRTIYGKWREIVLSLRIEAALGKSEILEAYLNHVPFGATTRGVLAAAEEYFDKSLGAMSLAEICTLAALPKGPSYYHPRRHLERLLERRNRIVDKLERRGLVSHEAAQVARREPLRLREGAHARAPHFVRALAQGRFDASGLRLSSASSVETTLDGELQAEVERIVADSKERLKEIGASAAAVVVLDNDDPALLAYVGAIDFFDSSALGQNDGCLSLRQPGSALKPFVYAAAIEWLRMGPNVPLIDVETEFKTATGSFSPKNYDGRYHGLVLLRDALGSSLNVPAVAVAERLGVDRLLTLLRKLGFRSLAANASHYGLGIALGDGEVRLLELAEAYSTLARHGLHRKVRVARRYEDVSGASVEVPGAEATRVLDETTAWQILEILSDDSARGMGFGRHGTLDLPVEAAVKTGTSSNHRDNWAVAVSEALTVAVWVGNFDGRPLVRGASGVVGAAPLLRSVMAASLRGRSSAALYPKERLATERVCKVSGQLPHRDCPDTVVMRTVVPHRGDRCSLHRRVDIDPTNGLLASRGCVDAVERVFEFYPERLEDWARSAGRPVPPTAESPRCPGGSRVVTNGALAFRTPSDGARYLIDPHLPISQQALSLRVKNGARTEWVEYWVDGERSGQLRFPFVWSWPLRRGEHRAVVVAANGDRDEVRFSVD